MQLPRGHPAFLDKPLAHHKLKNPVANKRKGDGA
jgi:hypothetical protein